jgi:hypothetical protein
MRQAGQQLGLDVEPAGVAYGSTAKTSFAGALVRGASSLAEIRDGAPLMLWYVESRGTSTPPDFYTASLSPTGEAVLKNSRGVPVATGSSSLKLVGGTTGYCEFEPNDDDVCLNCSTSVPPEFGGPHTWSVCFKLDTTFD